MLVTVPVKNPRPSGQKGTRPMPSSRRGRQDLGLDAALPQRILALHGGDGMDRVGAADGLGADFRQADEAHFAGRNQRRHGADGVLDRHLGVDPVQIEQVDHVGAETLERTLDGTAGIVGAAIKTGEAGRDLEVGCDPETEFRRDDEVAASARDGAADQLLVVVRTIDLGGIEEGDAQFAGAMDRGDGLCVVALPIGRGHAHAAEAEGGDGEVAEAADRCRDYVLHFAIVRPGGAARQSAADLGRQFSADPVAARFGS